MPLIGGFDQKTRLFFIKHISDQKYKFNGVSIHGFEPNKNEKIEDGIDFESIAPLIQSSNVNFKY